MNLLIVDLPERQAAENLRLDDCLLGISDRYFILRFWVNDPAVILGKFQRPEYEINMGYLQENGIPFYHRNTGGGTVYHDAGTLNITFVKPAKALLPGSPKKKASRIVTEIIRQTAEKDDIAFQMSERNAIYFGDRKILGSAVSLTGGKFRFHASLLVNSDLKVLRNCLNWQPQYPPGDKKLVQSHRDPVINLHDIYPVTIDIIKENLIRKMKVLLNPGQIIFITDREQLDFYCE